MKHPGEDFGPIWALDITLLRWGYVRRGSDGFALLRSAADQYPSKLHAFREKLGQTQPHYFVHSLIILQLETCVAKRTYAAVVEECHWIARVHSCGTTLFIAYNMFLPTPHFNVVTTYTLLFEPGTDK